MFRNYFILIILFSAVFVFGGTPFQKSDLLQYKKPKSIDEAVMYFEKKWSKKEKEVYKNLPEDKAIDEKDFPVGVWIRNEWVRFPKDTTLRYLFNTMGITHADDISDIILTCLHRKLNNEPFDIEGQVKKCKDYWTPVRECEAKVKEVALDNYDKFDAGDSITIFLFVEKLVGRNGVLIECPDNEWSFDYKKDLIVKGIVTEKYLLYGDPQFKVNITYMNFADTRILNKRAAPGDDFEFPIKYLLIKSPATKLKNKKRK